MKIKIIIIIIIILIIIKIIIIIIIIITTRIIMIVKKILKRIKIINILIDNLQAQGNISLKPHLMISRLDGLGIQDSDWIVTIVMRVQR